MNKKAVIEFDVVKTSQSSANLKNLEIAMERIRKQIRLAKKEGNEELFGRLKVDLAQVSEKARLARKEVKAFASFGVAKTSVIGMQKRVAKLRDEFFRLDTTARKSKFGQNIRREANIIQKELDEATGSFNRFRKSGNNLRGFGRNLLFAAGFAGGAQLLVSSLRDAGKVIVEYDRQLIAVGKTTDLEGPRLSRFGERAKELASDLKGVSIQGLLGAAEVAGQLGIEGSDNILRFSETLEKLKLTSDIIGQEAARNFAKFIEISSDSVENADRLGSVITDLGNNFATTESQILKNSTEIQKGVAIYNTSAEGILALGSATSALGSEAEQARSGIQKTFLEIDKAISTGEGLNEVLRITGLTESELAKQFDSDATVVFQKFVKGLSDIKEEGGNVNNTLADLDLQEKRTALVLGALSANYDTLSESVGRATIEYQNNIALNKESEAAAESLKVKMGDLKDAWDLFILSVEDGDGVLSNAFKNLANFGERSLGLFTEINNGNVTFLESYREFVGRFSILGGLLGVADEGFDKRIQNIKDAKSAQDDFTTSVDGTGEKVQESFDLVNSLNEGTLEYSQALIELAKNYDAYLEAIGNNDSDRAEEDLEGAADKLEIISILLNNAGKDWGGYADVANASLGRITGKLETTKPERRIKAIREELERLNSLQLDQDPLAVEAFERELSNLLAATRKAKIDAENEGGDILGLKDAKKRLAELQETIKDLRFRGLGNSEQVKTLQSEYNKLKKEIEDAESIFKKAKKAADDFTKGSISAMEKELGLIERQLKNIADLDVWIVKKREVEGVREQIRLLKTEQSRLSDKDSGLFNPVELLPTNNALNIQGEGGIGELSQEIIDSIGTKEALDKAADQSVIDNRIELERRAAEYQKQLRDEATADRLAQEEKVSERQKQAFDLFVSLSNDAFARIINLRKDLNEDAHQSEVDQLENRYNREIEAAGNNSLERKRLEKELAVERSELDKERARERQNIAKSEAIIQGALATIRSFATGNPFAAIGAALVTGTQVALIDAQNFAGGGQVKRQGPGRVTGPANIPTQSNGDNYLATLKINEAVLNEQQQMAAKRIAGSDFFNRIGVPGMASGGGIFAGPSPQIVDPSKTVQRQLSVQTSFDPESMMVFAQMVAEETAQRTAKAVSDALVETNNINQRNAKLQSK